MGSAAKKCLFEGVIVPTAIYGAEAWGMRSSERRKVNVLEMKCLKSLVGVSRMDRVGNEEARRRAGIERELASRADQRVVRWFGHVERMNEYHMTRRVLMAEVSGGRVRGRPRLGWIDGVKVALVNRRMTEGVESPDTYVTDEFHAAILLGPVFFRTALPCSGGYHLERGGLPLHYAVGINCEKGTTTENQWADVKYVG